MRARRPAPRSRAITARQRADLQVFGTDPDNSPDHLAEGVGVRPKALEKLRYRLYRKLKVRTGAGLLKRALELGLVACGCKKCRGA